jgi:hypothetical protein
VDNVRQWKERPTEYRKNNLAYSIEYPDEYIVPGGNSDWYTYHQCNHYDTTTYNEDLWGGVSKKKSIYDPCPEGWRVPLIDRNSTQSPWDVSDLEHWFAIIPGTADRESPLLGFYPATGAIYITGELPDKLGIELWTATSEFDETNINYFKNSSFRYSYSMRFVSGSQACLWKRRAEALNVRCIRDFK